MDVQESQRGRRAAVRGRIEVSRVARSSAFGGLVTVVLAMICSSGAYASVASAGPFKIACPSATLCVVADASGHVFTSTSPTSRTSSWAASDIDGSTPLSSISCPSKSLCVASDSAGDVLTSSNPAGGSSAWQVGSIGIGLTDISCPSIYLCVAVGRGDIAVSTNPGGGASTWTFRSGVDGTVGPECGKYGPDEGCSGSLTSVDCASVSYCVALDTWGATLESSDPAASATAWSGSNGAWGGGAGGGADIDALACPSTGLCVGACQVGVGLNGAECPGSTYDDGDVVVWDRSHPAALPQAFTAVSSGQLSGVWCQSASLCFASDDAGQLFESTSPASPSATWSVDATAPAAADGYDPIDSVSCSSASTCVAIADDGTILDTSRTSADATAAAAQHRVRFVRVARLGKAMRRHVASGRKQPTAGTSSRGLPTTLVLPRITTTGWLSRRRTIDAPAEHIGDRFRLRAVEVPLKPGVHARLRPHRAAYGPRKQAADTSGATGYGMSGLTALGFAGCDVSTVPCPTSGHLGCPSGPAGVGDCLVGFYETGINLFTELRNTLPLSYARFNVHYDDLDQWNGSECAPSYADTSGTGAPDFDQLVYDVQAAQADELTPVVVFTQGGGTSSYPTNKVPEYPDPGYGTSSSSPYSALTNAGYDYYCGVLGIMSAIGESQIGSDPVTDWEAFNEPNGSTQSNSNGGGYNGALGATTTYAYGACGTAEYNGLPNDCGGTTSPSTNLCYTANNDCGPTEAAELWELAQSVATGWFSSDNFTVAALTMSDAQNTTWLNGYAGPIVDFYIGASGYDFAGLTQWPGTWAVHDYDDPSSATGLTGDISAFTNALDNDFGTANDIWITETGVNLSDSTEDDQDRYYSGASSPWAGCTNYEGDHWDPSTGDQEFGGCTDAQPANQTTGADTFLNLASHGNGNTITQVDWYMFQTPNYQAGYNGTWDSGLVSAAQGNYVSPDGAYSEPRESYCVLTHYEFSACSSSTIDGEDWSTYPGGSGN